MFDKDFRVSVLTPTYNTEPRYLWELFQTLKNQLYGNWEWIVVDDGSYKPPTIAALRDIAKSDARIQITLCAKNQGISGASNSGLAKATGNYVALVDHDDLLSRDALLAAYEAWKNAPETQLFYTDECIAGPNGEFQLIWPKPDWSPAYLENTMCIGHLSIYKTDFLRSLGGFRSEYDGTQDYDLALRASLARPRVVHLPIFGYVWRAVPGSAAGDADAKGYVFDRQRNAVLDYAQQKDPQAKVEPGWARGFWRIIYPLPQPAPLLSYVIPTVGKSRQVRGATKDLVLNCVRSFERKQFYPNREYIILHNGNLSPAQEHELSAISGVRLVQYSSKSFNFSETINLGVSAARGSYICLLNDDVEAITPRGGEELISYLAANDQVGAIGPMCLREDNTIQQNGIVLLSVGPAHAGDGRGQDSEGYFGLLRCRREAFCIGGAALFMKKELFQEMGGFASDLPLNYNDVDFCLRLREVGYTCVVDPAIKVYHFEGATKSGTSAVEQELFFAKHPTARDPYFSKWFDQGDPNYRLNLSGPTKHAFGPWLDRHIAVRSRTSVPQGRHKLSVCVSVYDQPKRLLQEMYTSVTMQTYDNKELVILDNGSSNPETLGWLEQVRRESRATVIRSDANLGIIGGNLRLLGAMTGDYFVAMDAADFLTVDALQTMAYAIEANPTKKLFYSDEHKSDSNSTRFLPFFKPDFDPILLMNCCYPAHLMAMEAKFLREIEAFTDGRATWCHVYDTLTRALAVGQEPIHVRETIYAWRIHPGSTASAATSGKSGTSDPQRFALTRLLNTRGLGSVLSVETNRIESSAGMERLKTNQAVRGVKTFEARKIWSDHKGGIERLIAAASEAGTEWIAILFDPANSSDLLELSAIAHFDSRVNAVCGLLVDDGVVNWSGGIFLPDGQLFDPYAGQPMSAGGHHGLLWCQRCVDVAAPVNVLMRAEAIVRVAARSPIASADELMALLGLDAHERGEFIAVTPHLIASSQHDLILPPLDRSGVLAGHASLAHGSRWYDERLEAERPYKMAGLA